jgi:hypothetical protein
MKFTHNFEWNYIEKSQDCYNKGQAIQAYLASHNADIQNKSWEFHS